MNVGTGSAAHHGGSSGSNRGSRDRGGDGGFEHDVVVVGSGFGGSVAALRLAEKGYDVLVLEAGRRFADSDFARTSWRLRRYLWAPRLGCLGIQRIHLLDDVLVLAGAGVGGGSLVYANTLYVPPPGPFFADPQWSDITDWATELAPHYARAQRMLGVVDENPCEGPVEEIMRQAARELGVEHTVRRTPVGVFFGRDGAREPGVTVPDPYFGGVGPERTGCTECGNCMVGCRVGAKNTLTKNYLALAERLGVRIEPLRTVVDVRPLDAADPAAGWQVTTRRTGAWLHPDVRAVRARQVVLAAGTWGTQSLLHRLKATGVLPRLSDRLGDKTRTNSEALLGAMTEGVPDVDLTKGLAITTSFHPDEHTHIENVRYGRRSNVMGLLVLLLADGRADGRRGGRKRTVLRETVHRPGLLRFFAPPPARRFSERTIIGLVMQHLDNSIKIRARRRRLLPGWKLTSSQDEGSPNPTWIPVGHAAIRCIARVLSERTGQRTATGAPITDLFDIPMTAHFIGGCVIGSSPERGVVDPYHRVYGYPGLTIVDGSTLSANLGVNPSLTITAQAERAFAAWPNRGDPDPRPAAGEPYRTVLVDPRRPAVPVVRRKPVGRTHGRTGTPASATATNRLAGAKEARPT
ncbi:MAG TPA: GMC family oxidoreductase [Kineosporiaceae bacterium]